MLILFAHLGESVPLHEPRKLHLPAQNGEGVDGQGVVDVEEERFPRRLIHRFQIDKR